MIISNCEQRSEEWIKLKLGKPSSSNAMKILTLDGKPSKQREGYLHELIAEIITGKREEGYQNRNIIIGREREEESRQLYELINDVVVDQVGLIYKDKNKEFLCSPDGIVNEEYGLEMKNVLPKTQVKYLLKGKLPLEYFGQIQSSLYVTEFNRWDFMSYSPGLKPFIIRVERDEKFIKALSAELKLFCRDLKELANKIK